MMKRAAFLVLALFAIWLGASGAEARPISQSFQDYSAIVHHNDGPVQLAQVGIGTQPNYSQLQPAPSGGSPSYVFIVADHQDNGTATNTFTENLGTGSKFFIVASFGQNVTNITAITINGASLTSIVGNGVGTNLFSGTATVTGTDSIVVTANVSLAFNDNTIGVWSASNLISTTPVSSAFGGAGAATVTSSAAIGNFVFSACTANPAPNFTGSAQAPSGTRNATGANGNGTVFADWTASAGGISGGNFTSTCSTTDQPIQAVWH